MSKTISSLLLTCAIVLGLTCCVSAKDIIQLSAEINATKDLPQKRAIAVELAKLMPNSDKDVDTLVEVLRNGDDLAQSAAYKCLSNVSKNSTGLGQKYFELLDDKSEKVQMVGILGAAKLKVNKAAPKIHSILKDRPRFTIMHEAILWKVKGNEEKVRTNYRMAKALVSLDYFPVIDEIVSRREFMAFHGIAGGFIARFGARGLPKLLEMARDRNTQTSTQGRSGIIAIHDEAAIPELIKLLNDSDKGIVTAALYALKEMPNEIKVGDEDGLTVLAPVPFKKDELDSVEKIVNPMLNDSDPAIKSNAFGCLLRLFPKKYLPTAIETIKTNGAMNIRIGIVKNIASSQNRDAVPYLEELIKWDEEKEPNFRYFRAAVAQAIYKLAGRKVPYKGIEEDMKLYKNPYDTASEPPSR